MNEHELVKQKGRRGGKEGREGGREGEKKEGKRILKKITLHIQGKASNSMLLEKQAQGMAQLLQNYTCLVKESEF